MMKKIGLVGTVFTSEHIRTAANTITGSDKMADNAAALGRKLIEAGDMNVIIGEVTEDSRT